MAGQCLSPSPVSHPHAKDRAAKPQVNGDFAGEVLDCSATHLNLFIDHMVSSSASPVQAFSSPTLTCILTSADLAFLRCQWQKHHTRVL